MAKCRSKVLLGNACFIAKSASTFCLLLAITTFALINTGCSEKTKRPSRVALRGRVTLDERPLPSGVIKFVPTGDAKGPVAVMPIKDGSYSCATAEGPVVGNYRVEIESGMEKELADLASDPVAFKQHVKVNGKPTQPDKIPTEFNQRSTLTAQIDGPATQKCDFALVTTSATSALKSR